MPIRASSTHRSRLILLDMRPLALQGRGGYLSLMEIRYKSTSRISENASGVWFIPLQGFSMLGLLSAVEPLRVANQIRPGSFFWDFHSEDGAPVTSSNGMTILTEKFPESSYPGHRISTIFVCAGFNPEKMITPSLSFWLSKAAAAGISLGGIDTGSIVLARCGLLKGYKATVHWENLASFREDFQGVTATGNIYEIDRDRITCSGATASLDMMLELISREHGDELSQAISEQFIMDRIRDPKENQRIAPSNRLASPAPALSRAMAILDSAAENSVPPPFDANDLSSRCGVSPRQLNRLFKDKAGDSPSAYYRRRRLEKARRLLRQTDMRALDVAIACGFSSQAHFSRSYRKHFGQSPGSERS